MPSFSADQRNITFYNATGYGIKFIGVTRPGDEEFEVTLADDIAPGTYTYFCTLHRQDMEGKVIVK